MGTININSVINLAVRDFDGLRQAFREYAQSNFSDVWTDFNDNSFANAISEIVAYLGDNLHFYIDRQTQDNFLPTTQDRQSAIDLAALINYRPFNASPASGTITLTLDTGTFVYGTPIGAGFKVSSGTDIIYETTSTVTVPFASPTVDLDISEGETISETVGGLGAVSIADGSQFQTYQLSRTNVILSRTIDDINNNSNLVVEVNGDLYLATDTLSTALSSDKVYTIQTNNDNETSITFGNGEFGVIPSDGFTIEATYRILEDSDIRLEENNGNAAPNTVTSLVSQRTGVSAVNNAAALTGGGPQETLEEIKINAPASLAALNRAVSLSDFATLAKDVTGVAKSVATSAEGDLDVLVYVAPNGGGLPSNSLKTQVVDSFIDKKLAKTTVFARDPNYQDVLVNLRIFVESNFKTEEVLDNVRTAIADLFSFENMDFSRPVLLKSTSSANDIHDLYETLESVDGINRLEPIVFTMKPTVFPNNEANSGALSISSRSPTVRVAARRAEFGINMEGDSEYSLTKSLFGTSTTLNDTTITDDTIDLSLQTGTSTDAGILFLQDSSKAFVIDEFAGQTLIDSTGSSFLIDSNTSDTITVSSGTPTDGDYLIVERFVGALLQPNTSKDDEFRVIANGRNSYVVSSGLGTVASAGNDYKVKISQHNEFTDDPVAGKAGPLRSSLSSFSLSGSVVDTLTDSSIAGTYADDAFNGYHLVITTGNGSNEISTVVDYIGATGTFTLGGPGSISGNIVPADEYVVAPKFNVGVSAAVDSGISVPSTTEFSAPELSTTVPTDFYKNWKVKFTSGTNDGLVRIVNAYAPGSQKLTVDDLPTAPADTDTFEVAKDYEDNERSITFATVGDLNLISTDKFFFVSSNLVGDILPGTTQILQVNSDETTGDITLTGVGGTS